MHVALCGLDCSQCKVYQATQMAEGMERKHLQEVIAADWTERFHYNFEPKHMICHGCQSDQLCGYCQQCDMRACAQSKALTACKDCETFPCERLTTFKENAAEEGHTFLF